jgi:hypothetical protein
MVEFVHHEQNGELSIIVNHFNEIPSQLDLSSCVQQVLSELSNDSVSKVRFMVLTTKTSLNIEHPQRFFIKIAYARKGKQQWLSSINLTSISITINVETVAEKPIMTEILHSIREKIDQNTYSLTNQLGFIVVSPKN